MDNGKNNTNIEKFRQLKKDIRGSDKHLVVGVDIAKNKHYAFFGTAKGKTMFKRLIFDNNEEGVKRLLLHAKAMATQGGCSETVYGVEPTANYHKALADFLVKQGHMVVLVSANAVKKNRELLDGRWDKNDTKDAANVADLISQGKFLYFDFPSPEIRNLRSLLSFKRKLKKQEHSSRMRIRNHMIPQYFPELDRYLGKCEAENLAIVKWCLSPEAIAGMEFKEFFNTVTTRDRGAAQKQRLKEIWQIANGSIGCEFGQAAGFEAKILVDSLKSVRQTITETEKEIETVCQQFEEYQYVRSIPGIGPAISAMILGAIGNPHRFTNAKQVLKLAGLDLSASRSGKNSANITPSLSKKGKAELRYGLYQAALIASSKNRDFMEYFTAKITGREREKGIKTKMRVKLSAKMLTMAWTLMKKKEAFSPMYLGN